MEFFDVIRNRRSIRRYTTDPVDDEKIEMILEAGRWAPSWSNSQCWRFVVVRDPDVKGALAGTLMRFKLPDKEIDNPAIPIFHTVPVIIVVCAEMGKSGGQTSLEEIILPIKVIGLCSIRLWPWKTWYWLPMRLDSVP